MSRSEDIPAETLLPCPFCGGTDILVVPRTCNRDTPYDPADIAYPRAACRCGVEVAGGNWGDPKTAVAAWNRRDPAPILAAEQRGADRQREAAQYLVWSNEHMAWWRAQSRGYSRSILGAGLYTRAEALDIAATSRDGWKADRAPDEIAVSIDDIPPHIAAAIRNTKG